ncbi:hypothetical protein SNK04_013594 [Fusarium graminearum]
MLYETKKKRSQACAAYNKHLEWVLEQNQDEYISRAAVENAMEFVYLMSLDLAKGERAGRFGTDEPLTISDGFSESDSETENSGSDTESSDGETEYRSHIKGIARQYELKEFAKLLKAPSGSFSEILKKLSPFYNLRGRQETFRCVFERHDNQNQVWSLPWQFKIDECQHTGFMDQIGFPNLHRQVGDLNQTRPSVLNKILGISTFKKDMKQDIFGWTALHYAAARSKLFGESTQKGGSELSEAATSMRKFFDGHPPNILL